MKWNEMKWNYDNNHRILKLPPAPNSSENACATFLAEHEVKFAHGTQCGILITETHLAFLAH